ncbi:type IIS restriction-modification system N6 adenine-specific DNA methyltransferase [Cuniculiplasma divulgatum]|uniref:site-specific DNA-methyltransferase (adenine-specific) n=1 Tax=Cuniculiplasma divulgatum TaxID=1673428 RepID=A0A1R4A652_9ARCH|nr:type IIS restriction-modification system N6 adenine-specific DNA methyltransferase [Cuniculiplasma divulgatum]
MKREFESKHLMVIYHSNIFKVGTHDLLLGKEQINVFECICERCGHDWIARREEAPIVCPKCKSPYWDKPISNNSANQAVLSYNTLPLSKIPQFRLIGNKYRVLNNLSNIIRRENIEGLTFFDVFSGSAAVSRYFKKSFAVISNDSLYFSYVLQKALVELNEYPDFSKLNFGNLSLIPEERVHSVLEYLNMADGVEGFVYNHYTPASKNRDGIERMYFSEVNGRKIDSIRSMIEEWFKCGNIDDNGYFYLIASLLLAVQKISNISGTYGAYNKTWDPRAKKLLSLKFIEVIHSEFRHQAFNEDSFEILNKIECDVAYIDPPYNERQYIANYHLLETIAKYDDPIISGKTGIRNYTNREKSLFCSKRTVGSALMKLLSSLRTKYVILSYNSEGLLSKEEIMEIFERTGLGKPNLYEFPYRRFNSNHNSHNNRIEEYVFVCKGTK